MFSYYFRHFNPDSPEAAESIELYQMAQFFRQEVEYRTAFEEYCQWYQEVAEHHQQELVQMRKEPNLFNWFCRTRQPYQD